MNSFSSLPVLVQNICCFWALLIYLLGIAGTLLLIRQKRYTSCALSVSVFALAYFLMQVFRSLSELRLHGTEEELALSVCSLPYGLLIAVLAVLTLAAALLYIDTWRWGRAHINLGSIKESMDGLPAGICF